MDQFWNSVKAHAAGLDGMSGVARFGLVTSFDPAAYAARVQIQPENVLSGWLPVLSCWVGNGWGLGAPLTPGDQVLVIALEGDAEQGVVIGSVWSAVDKAMNIPSEEIWLRHKTGSSVKLQNDGTIALMAPLVNISGDLIVSGDISDRAGAHGTLDTFRRGYDEHTHSDQGGETGLPSVTV